MLRAALIVCLGCCACARSVEPLPQAEAVAAPEVTVAPTPFVSVEGPGPLDAPRASALPALTALAQLRAEPAGATGLDTVRSLYFDIEVSGAPRGAQLAAEWVANGAVVYERRTAVLDQGPAAPQQHSFELPVAGTMIRQSKLGGPWTARFFVDDVEVSSLAFELTP